MTAGRMIGQTLSHYRITAPLGQGGMGIVYRAEDTRLGRPVALKVLPEELARDPEAIERFEREARAASRLSHPHICAVYDVGADGGRHFIVMEYLEGATLDAHLRRGPMTAHEIAARGIELADALDTAHRAGLLHRDVKPANVFITARGDAKLLDFGLAKPASAGTPAATTHGELTRDGEVPGTLAYMSPEQIRGEPLDARSDMFSLGAVLYQMAAGRQPFDGQTPGVIQEAILNRTPPTLARSRPDVPASLESAIAKALEKDRRLRYQNAADLRADLLRVKRDLESGTGGGAGSGRTGTARRRWTWPAAALLLVAIGAAAWQSLIGTTPGAIDSVAVLPFENGTGNTDAEYLSDGLTESLINSLSQVPGVRVSGRGAAFRHRGADPQAAGRALGVRAVLSGRLLRRGDTFVVRTDLMDVASGSHLWGDEYPRPTRDLLALQRDLASAISEQLRVRLTAADRERLASPTTSPQAYEIYLRGRHELLRRSPDSSLRARDYFLEAINLDARYALAHVGLAEAYNLSAFFNALRPRDAIPAAKQAAAQALRIDERLADAHAALAWASMTYDWDYPASTEHMERALALDPNVREHFLYPFYLTIGRRHDDAIAAAREIVERDRLAASASHTLAVQFILARRFAEGIEESRRTIQLDPSFGVGHEVLAPPLVVLGAHAEALKHAQRAVDLSPGNLVSLAMLGWTHGQAGNRAAARDVLQRLDALASSGRYVPAHAYAIVHSGLGDADQTFAWLERSYEERFNRLAYIDLEPGWDPIRRDPRFEALVARIGLPRQP